MGPLIQTLLAVVLLGATELGMEPEEGHPLLVAPLLLAPYLLAWAARASGLAIRGSLPRRAWAMSWWRTALRSAVCDSRSAARDSGSTFTPGRLRSTRRRIRSQNDFGILRDSSVDSQCLKRQLHACQVSSTVVNNRNHDGLPYTGSPLPEQCVSVTCRV